MSPQRDDVPALSRSLSFSPAIYLSDTHTYTSLGFLLGFFSEQFVLFSILSLAPQIHVLSISCILPLCHSVRMHTHAVIHTLPHLCGSTCLPWMTKILVLSFVIYYCRWSHHFAPWLSLAVHIFIYSDLSHFLSFLSACLCLFRHISLSFFSLHSPPPSLPLHPHVQLLLAASFP